MTQSHRSKNYMFMIARLHKRQGELSMEKKKMKLWKKILLVIILILILLLCFSVVVTSRKAVILSQLEDKVIDCDNDNNNIYIKMTYEYSN